MRCDSLFCDCQAKVFVTYNEIVNTNDRAIPTVRKIVLCLNHFYKKYRHIKNEIISITVIIN